MHGRMYFRADAAFAEPKIYELLEAEGIRYKGRGTAEQHLPRMLGPVISSASSPVSSRSISSSRGLIGTSTMLSSEWNSPMRLYLDQRL